MIDPLVIDIVLRLYGPAAVLSEEGRCVSPTQRFLTISGNHGPRWIVPERPFFGWPVLRQWQPYSVSSLCKWTVFTLAYRCGQLGRVPGVRRISIVGGEASQPVFQVPGGKGAFVPVIYIGTPGRARKAVVTLVGKDDARPVAVAKLPFSDGAASNILHEADVLARLIFFRVGLAPRLLSVDAERGTTVQEEVPGRLTGRKLTNQHIDWLCLLRTGKTTTIADHSRELLARIQETPVDSSDRGTYLIALLRGLDNTTPLPAVWVHGDFAPWNLKETTDGLRAIDWEEAQEGGLPLVDLVYFFVIQGFLFGRRLDCMDDFFRHPQVPRYLVEFGLGQEQANQALLLALSSFWLRRIRQGEHQHAAFLHAIIERMNGRLL